MAIAGLVAFNTYMATDIFKSNGTNLASVFSLSEVMAELPETGTEFINGVDYHVNEKLKSRLCALPLLSTRLKCVSEENFFCDPSDMTACGGGTIPGL